MKKRVVDFNDREIKGLCIVNNRICDKCLLYVNKNKLCKELHLVQSPSKLKQFLDREWCHKKLCDLSQEQRDDICKVFCKSVECSIKCPFYFDDKCHKDLIVALSKENKESTYAAFEHICDIRE